MPKERSPLEVAAGKLIAAIQKEWTEELGEVSAAESEQVMHASHELLKAAREGSLKSVLGSQSIADFLGRDWVSNHPRVQPFIAALQASDNARD
jgi:hypothetical protein